jgi:hypothetical protein
MGPSSLTAYSSPRIQRLRIGFPHQLPQLSRKVFSHYQIGAVALYSQGRSGRFDARESAGAREFKGSFYRIYAGRHA